MTSAIHSLLALVAAHPQWAYATVLLLALLEAVPVVGSFIPGSTIILGLGATITTAGLNLPAMLAAAVAGALIGDGAAYLAGRRGKSRILQAWPLSAYPAVVARSERFFARHGMLAVFFARFVAPVRAFVPVTAGALGMAPRQFFPVNVMAIALWAPLHILPGLAAAAALQQLGAAQRLHLFGLAGIGVATGVIGWAIWQHLRRPEPVPVPVVDRRNAP